MHPFDMMLTIQIGQHIKLLWLSVTNTGSLSVILGHSWLVFHNPNINWKKNKMCFSHCPLSCGTDVLSLPDPDGKLLCKLDEDVVLPLSNAKFQEEWVHNMLDELTINNELFAIDLKQFLDNNKVLVNLLEHLRKMGTQSGKYSDRYIKDFSPVFSKDNFNKLPPWQPWDHTINLKLDAKTIKAKIFALSLSERIKLKDWIAEQKSTGRICDSIYPFALLFFFAKKKDGDLCPIQDYQKLNDMTIKNRYTLLLISDLMDKLKGTKFFTKVKVCWGFNNVRIHKGDKHKAAFITGFGLFKPLVMFF